MSVLTANSGTLLRQAPSPASVYMDLHRQQLAYPSAMGGDLVSTLIPSDVKGIHKLCRYFFNFDPLVHAAVRNMAIYPLTPLTIQSSKYPKEAANLTDILYREMELQRLLIAMSIDYFLYGNAFCMHLDLAGSRLPTFRRVPVEEMSLGEDPCTGLTRYFWLLSPAIRRTMQHKADPEFSDDYKDFMTRFPGAHMVEQAFKENKALIMKRKHLYHLRMEGDSGSGNHWGFSSVQPVLKHLFYRNILRRAQEALAQEHIVPLRIFYLNPVEKENYNLDAYEAAASSLSKILKTMASDPNMKVVSPVPVGMTSAGGQGRMLMVTPEIQQVEETILAGMLVPREFVFGGLSYSGTSVSMRMLENRILPFRTQTQDMVQNYLLPHVCRAVYPEFDSSDFVAKFASMKAIDDVQQKSMLVNLNSSGKLPDSVLYDAFDMDPDDMRNGVLEDIRVNAERQTKAAELELQTKLELLPKQTQVMFMEAQAQMQAQAGMAQQQPQELPQEQGGEPMPIDDRPLPEQRPPRRASLAG